jgi:hypothetical membrane protein
VSLRTSGFAGRVTGRMAVGGLLWILTLVFFAGQAIAQLGWTGTSYSLAHNTVSDLGTTVCQSAVRDGRTVDLCSPWHTAMNLGFILTGIFILGGLVLLRDCWPPRRLASLGLACLAYAGIGKIVVGLVPWNVDLTVHTVGGLGFLVGDAGLVFLGLALRMQNRAGATLAIVLGGLGLIGLLAAPAGIGIAERVADYPMFAWFVIVGASFARHARAQAF